MKLFAEVVSISHVAVGESLVHVSVPVHVPDFGARDVRSLRVLGRLLEVPAADDEILLNGVSNAGSLGVAQEASWRVPEVAIHRRRWAKGRLLVALAVLVATCGHVEGVSANSGHRELVRIVGLTYHLRHHQRVMTTERVTSRPVSVLHLAHEVARRVSAASEDVLLAPILVNLSLGRLVRRELLEGRRDEVVCVLVLHRGVLVTLIRMLVDVADFRLSRHLAALLPLPVLLH